MSFGDLSFKEKNLSKYSTRATLQLNPSLLFRILHGNQDTGVSTTARGLTMGIFVSVHRGTLSTADHLCDFQRGHLEAPNFHPGAVGKCGEQKPETGCAVGNKKYGLLDTCVISPSLIWYYIQ